MGNNCFKAKDARLQNPGPLPDEATELASQLAENSTPREANVGQGVEVCASSTLMPLPSILASGYYSTRIAAMIASKSDLESENEFETASSRVHWSQLSREGASSCEDSVVDHRQHFETLQKDAHWGLFCNQVKDIVLGRKLGEGAQADIYEAEVTFVKKDFALGERVGVEVGHVVKVFKGDCALEELQCQWPRGIADAAKEGIGVFSFGICGALVKEPTTGRSKFGFVMNRCWGDLRKLIDLRMVRNNAIGPPFSFDQARNTMMFVAFAVNDLHRRGIIHKDLKASNVLLSRSRLRSVQEVHLLTSDEMNFTFPNVADWECSAGIVGSGFWRAPEILQQLKDGVPCSEVVFNEKTDVYSYGMMCYEIITGLVPFEGLPIYATRDAILSGAQPKLPDNLEQGTRTFIESCWDPNPARRPSFSPIVDFLVKLFPHLQVLG